jgi:hypothetical protein
MKKELTIDTLVSNYTDAQIKDAVSQTFGGESPLHNALNLIDAMAGFVINESTDVSIRMPYAVMYEHLQFHLRLYKLAIT